MKKSQSYAGPRHPKGLPARSVKGTSAQTASEHAVARQAAARPMEHAETAYCRQRHLPHLIPVEPKDLADNGAAAAQRIIALLGKALRAERRLGNAGHWSYDLNRHMSLVAALKAENAAQRSHISA